MVFLQQHGIPVTLLLLLLLLLLMMMMMMMMMTVIMVMVCSEEDIVSQYRSLIGMSRGSAVVRSVFSFLYNMEAFGEYRPLPRLSCPDSHVKSNLLSIR